MRTHAHWGGKILCGQANAKNVPKFAFEKLSFRDRCKKCQKVIDSLRIHYPRTAGGNDGN